MCWPAGQRPPQQGLVQAGRSHGLPLSQVVPDERWPTGERVSPPPSHLRVQDQSAAVAAHDEANLLLTPPGSLGARWTGVLDRAVALEHRELTGGTLVLVAADHPVAEHWVSAYPVEVTRQVLAAAAVGQAMGAAAAHAAGLAVELLDVGVSGDGVPGVTPLACEDGRSDTGEADAMSMRDVLRLLATGRDLGARLAPGGLVALCEVGVGNTTRAGSLAFVLLDSDPDAVVALGAGRTPR